MKYKNLALKKYRLSLAKSKWHLWHGNPEKALSKLFSIRKKLPVTKDREKLLSLHNYLLNNQDKLIHYQSRKKSGEVFTSQLTESTVESLINQRCKGKQHIQ